MEWIWLIFVLFSIIGGIMERSGKTKRKTSSPARRPEKPSYPPGEGQFFLDEEWEEKNVSSRGETTGREMEAPGHARSFSGGDLTPAFWEEETTVTAGPGELAGKLRAMHAGDFDEDMLEEESGQQVQQMQRWRDPEAFLSALALAQVLKRPDFKTIPWQRRI